MPQSSLRARPLGLLVPLLLLIVLAVVYWRYNASHPGPSALPRVSLPSLSGQTVNIDQLTGKPLVVNLWATWCPPCRAELPLLETAARQHPGIRFEFAEQGDTRGKVAAFAQSFGLASAQVLLDETTSLSKFYGVLGYPTTAFYNAHGGLIGIHRGELTQAVLDHYLSKITGQ